MQRRELPEGWDQDLPTFPADAEGPRQPRLVGQGAERGRQERAVADRRLGRSGAVDQDAPDLRRRRRLRGRQLRRPQLPLRHPRARHGRDPATACRCRRCAPSARASSSSPTTRRGSIRLSALMELPVIYIFTHDSIGVGEDGPTHQPVEQLASLRAIPGSDRPAPGRRQRGRRGLARDHAAAARAGRAGPVAARTLPTLDRTQVRPGRRAWPRAPTSSPTRPAASPRSSCSPPAARWRSASRPTSSSPAEGIKARVVSMPSWELFEQQPQAYRDSVLPPDVTRARRGRAGLDLRLGALRRLARRAIIGMQHLRRLGAAEGAAAQKFGFTAEHVVAAAKAQLARARAAAADGTASRDGAESTVPREPRHSPIRHARDRHPQRKESPMKAPTPQLHEAGQSLWLDNITRDAAHQRHAQALHRRAVGHRADLEPDDLRPRHQQEHGLRRGHPREARGGQVGRGALLRAGASRT